MAGQSFRVARVLAGQRPEGVRPDRPEGATSPITRSTAPRDVIWPPRSRDRPEAAAAGWQLGRPAPYGRAWLYTSALFKSTLYRSVCFVN
jgi:hypothetical protein